MTAARRVTVIAHELRGFHPVGGMGTATAFLALALSRLGHPVEILLGKHDVRAIDRYWEEIYEGAGIRIRPVPQAAETIQPWEFAHAHRVMLGLREDPPEVVVAHDFGAPAYSALRLRQAGLGFEETLFVIFCHGPRRYVVDLAPELPLGDLRAVLGVSILEQAAVELADVVVSPSAFLLDWMRRQGWKLPERSLVIPYFTRTSAIGASVPPAARPSPDPLRRLTFFGRVDEKKGLKVFAGALQRLEPKLLDGLEIEFVGRTTATWSRDRVESLLPSVAELTLTGELEQHEALARLARPGTLVVMPSLQENSPNAVYECLEHGIPFIASDVGGVPELIAPDDRPRVLFEPTPEALAAVLRGIFADGNVPPAPRPAIEPLLALRRWGEVVELPAARRFVGDADATEYVLVPGADEALRDTLLRAQRASGADVVTCGVRLPGNRLHFFAGDAGGLGAIGNAYGTIALVRRDLLENQPAGTPDERDPMWALLAHAAASGASIVSIPLSLADAARAPGTVDDDPAAALRAVRQLESVLPDALRGSARLAAGLAAAATGEPRRDWLTDRARVALKTLLGKVR